VTLHALEPNREILRQFSKLISSRCPILASSQRDQLLSQERTQARVDSIFFEGLLGINSWKRGFRGVCGERRGQAEDQGKTKTDDREYKLFLAIFQNSQKANQALKDFKDDLSRKGKVSSGSIVGFETRALKEKTRIKGRSWWFRRGSISGDRGVRKGKGGQYRC